MAYPNANNLFNRGFFSIDERNWSGFVVPMIRLQINIAMFTNNIESQDQIISTVVVVPLYHMKRHNVVLDTTALYAGTQFESSSK